MRTTVRLDDDLYLAIKALATARRVPFGQVLSELARRGLQERSRPYADPLESLPVFDVREDAPILTPELIAELRDDDV